MLFATIEEMDISVTYSQSIKYFKPFLMIILITGFVFLYLIAGTRYINSRKERGLIAKVPLKYSIYNTLGGTYEPILKIKVKLPNGYEEYDFLIDSGATVSSLPYEMAGLLNLDVSNLPRIAFTGYGNTTSFAYQGAMTIALGANESTIPVVFTEESGSKLLIGRKGFFENYSVIFNHLDNTLEIKK